MPPFRQIFTLHLFGSRSRGGDLRFYWWKLTLLMTKMFFFSEFRNEKLMSRLIGHCLKIRGRLDYCELFEDSVMTVAADLIFVKEA